MNSPCAMLMTPIWPKITASPSPISSSTLNRLRPAKPCISVTLRMSEADMRLSSKCPLRAHAAVSAHGLPRQCLLITLRERIRLDQIGRLGHHLELAVRLRLTDARAAPQMMVRVDLHVAFRRGLQLDAGRCGDHLVDVEAAGFFNRRFP